MVDPNPKPDSKRSKRRKNRSFQGKTRAMKRAERRLGENLSGYQRCCALDTKTGGKGFNKPGAMRYH